MRLHALASAVLLTIATAAAPAVAKDNIDKVFGGIVADAGRDYGRLEGVNGGITIRAGATVDSAETVNGGITIGRDAKVGEAETVNGGIDVEEGATIGSLEVVNGGIDIGARVVVERDVEAVNGGVRVGDGSRVGGNVETVNGGLRLTGATVGRGVALTNGDIVLERTTVRGDVLVRKQENRWWNLGTSRIPRVVIGAGSVVEGRLVFEREVELYVDPSAKAPAPSGVAPKMIASPDAPR